MAGRILVVGLGPGDPTLRTLAAQRVLESAPRIILRTAVHPGVEDLLADPRTSTCDDLYKHAPSFDVIYESIADRIVQAAETEDVAYAVPGHPFLGERSVKLLQQRAAQCSIAVEIIGGVSALDALSQELGVDLLEAQAQIVDAEWLAARVAEEPFSGGLLDVAPTRPCLVLQVCSRAIASSVKLALMRAFPEDHDIVVVSAAAVPGERVVRHCRLHELDHHPVDHLTSVWVDPLPVWQASRSPATLHSIVGRLRSPRGCPWDREQSHQSLRAAVIEEAHEVVDAIDEGDPVQLAEELGDLLLQVALHAQIAEEAGDFTIEEIYDHVNRKLVRRHPHVFGDASATTPDQVLTTWQEIKEEERRSRGTVEPDDPFSRLPRSMPILTRVAQVVARSWPNAGPSVADGPGERLLTAVEEVVRAGLDPERELERAVRCRLRATAGERVQADSG